MEELTSGAQDGIGLAADPVPTPGGPASVVTLDLTMDDVTPRSGPETDPGPPVGLGPPAPIARPAPVPRIRFTTFVVTEADRLLGTACLLTGDQERAEELLRAALAATGAGWPQRRSDPVADVLRAMARLAAGPIWWWPRPNDAEALPGDVGTGLARLSSRHRVALVLRYHQRRTEEETAAALGAPVGNVRSWLSQALDRLGIDTRLDLRAEAGPGLSRGGLSDALAALSEPTGPSAASTGLSAGRPALDASPARTAPDAADFDAARRLEERLVDVRRRLPALRRRERRRRAAIATVIAAASIGVIAGGLALAGPVPDPTRTNPNAPPPNHPPTPDPFAFADDLAGDPLIGNVVGDRGQESLELRFTPGTTSLAFSEFCQIDVEDGTRLRSTLNGHELHLDPCRTDDHANQVAYSRDDYPKTTDGGWSDLGVRRGRESVLRLRVISAQGAALPAGRLPHEPGRIGIAVYQLSGPRVVSDGVIIKREAEQGRVRYVLGDYRTAKITPSVRDLSLRVPAGVGPTLVRIGMPDSRGTTDIAMPMTLDGVAMPPDGGAIVTTTLPDGAAHEFRLGARAEDTGAMLLAWYKVAYAPVK